MIEIQEEIRPQAGPQTDFLSTPADIAIYGGSAGGGKTYGLLLEPTRHIHNKKFGAVIFRRTLKQVKMEGGMWDESQLIYPDIGGIERLGDTSWTFPSGARIGFAGMQYESDMTTYQGAQIPLIEFDQLEEFTKRMFFFMLSRNRSMSGVKSYIRATCNPDPDSFLREFIDWWIAKDGYANLSRAGLLRWFIRSGDDIIWANSPDVFKDRLEPGVMPKSVTFIPASVYDNKLLLKFDPGYLSNLQALSLVDRLRLLGDRKRGGNWNVRIEGGNLFNRAWFEIVPAAPAGGEECSFWDFAATKKEFSKPDPDFSARVKIRKVKGIYYIMDVWADQVGPVEVERNFVSLTRQDAQIAATTGTKFKYAFEIEPGSAAKREAMRLVRLLDGLTGRGVRPRGDKVARLKPLASQAEAGNVKVVAGAWNDMFINHMHNLPPQNASQHDDIGDAASGAHEQLSGGAAAKSATINWNAEAPVDEDELELGRTQDEVDQLLEDAKYGGSE